jgi:hypothetical protein
MRKTLASIAREPDAAEGATEHGSCGLAELGMSYGDNAVTVPVIAS